MEKVSGKCTGIFRIWTSGTVSFTGVPEIPPI